MVNSVADAELTQAKTAEIMVKIGGEVAGAEVAGAEMQAGIPVPAEPQVDPYEMAKRELELENLRIDNAAKFAALTKTLQQQANEEAVRSSERPESEESDDKVGEDLDELKAMVEALARQVADLKPQQPIIVATGGGGKKIQITKTPTGFSGEVVNEE